MNFSCINDTYAINFFIFQRSKWVKEYRKNIWEKDGKVNKRLEKFIVDGRLSTKASALEKE